MSRLRERLAIRARSRARERFWNAHDRETYRCPCGSDGPFEVHHRDGDYLNNELLNLVGLCHRCHRAIHRHEQTVAALEAWKASVDDLGRPVAADGGER